MQIAAAQAAALAEDSTVYEYDSLYDDMQRSRESAKRKELEDRKPKYIQALMQKAEIRKKEQDIAYERRLVPQFHSSTGRHWCRAAERAKEGRSFL